MSQKQFVAIIVGVCVLSAAIGSGLALVAQTGPEGPAGKRGPAGKQGPRGPRGASAAPQVEALESEVEELRGRVEGTEELEGRVEELESQLSGLGGPNSTLCEEFGIFC